MNVKKIIAASTAAVVVASQALTAVSMAATTTANYPDEWEQAVSFMNENGLSSTASNVGEYQPLATVKREAAAKFFVNFAKKFFNKQANTTKVCMFSDINEAQSWAVPYIIEACQMGLLKGSDGKFMPKAELTKLQFLTVLARMVKNDPSIEPVQAFNLMKQEGVTKAVSVQSTVRPVTRIELAILFMRAADKYAQQTQSQWQQASNQTNQQNNQDIASILNSILGNGTSTENNANNTENISNTNESSNNENNENATETTSEETETETTTEETNETVAGENVLTVSLDPNTPPAQYIPGTGSSIKVMTVDLTAGSDDVTVNSIVVKMNSLGSVDKLWNVYFVDEDGAVLTNQRNFSTTTKAATLVFETPLVVKAGTVKKITLAIDTKTEGTTQVYRFEIPSKDSISTSTEIEGQFPIVSNEFTTTSYSAGTLNITNGSTTTGILYVGDKQKEVAVLKLDYTNDNHNDGVLKVIRLKNSKRVGDYFDNFKVVINGQNVLEKAIVSGKYVTLLIKDYEIPYGSERTVYVYADVIGGETGDQPKFKVDETSDVTMIEKWSNAAVNVTLNGWTSSLSLKPLKIQEGDNLITKASDSPVSQDIPADATDIVVLKANVSFSNPVRVDKLGVYLEADTGLNNIIKNVKLYVNDRLVDVVSDGDASLKGTSGVVKFSYYDTLWTSNKFVVKIDTQRSTSKNNIDGKKLKVVKIWNTVNDYFEGIEYAKTGNWDDSNDKIKGEAKAESFTIRVPKIVNATKVDGYASTDYIIAGATNFKLLSTQVQANNVGSLTITDITVQLSGNSNATNWYIPVAKLVVDGNVVDTESVSSEEVVFNSLNIGVDKASTKKFDIVVDTTTNLTGKLQAIVDKINYTDQYGNTNKYTDNVTGTVFTVKTGASVDITLNSNSPVEQVVAANPNVETEIARFDFKPLYDNAQLQELTLRNVDTGDNTTGEADSLIQSVYLYDTNGNKLAEASLSSGQVDFNLSNALDLVKDETTTVVVKVKTNSINDKNLTNKFVRFKVFTGTNGYGGAETRIISVSNGNKISIDSDVKSNKIVFRKTILTFANDPQTTTTLSNGGSNDLYLWNVTADSAGAAKIKQFKIYLSATNTGTTYSDYQLYVNGSKLNTSDVEFITNNISHGSGNLVVVFTWTNYGNGYEVSAGSTVHFKLVATVKGANDDNDTVTARLKNEGTRYDMNTVSNLSGLSYSVIWTDEAAKGTVTTGTVDRFTDKGLLSLPLDWETLSK